MLTVIWSGTLERQGLCPSLSSYEGPSMLSAVIDDPRTAKPTPLEAARWRKKATHTAKQLGQQLIRWDI